MLRQRQHLPVSQKRSFGETSEQSVENMRQAEFTHQSSHTATFQRLPQAVENTRQQLVEHGFDEALN